MTHGRFLSSCGSASPPAAAMGRTTAPCALAGGLVDWVCAWLKVTTSTFPRWPLHALNKSEILPRVFQVLMLSVTPVTERVQQRDYYWIQSADFITSLWKAIICLKEHLCCSLLTSLLSLLRVQQTCKNLQLSSDVTATASWLSTREEQACCCPLNVASFPYPVTAPRTNEHEQSLYHWGFSSVMHLTAQQF